MSLFPHEAEIELLETNHNKTTKREGKFLLASLIFFYSMLQQNNLFAFPKKMFVFELRSFFFLLHGKLVIICFLRVLLSFPIF